MRSTNENSSSTKGGTRGRSAHDLFCERGLWREKHTRQGRKRTLAREEKHTKTHLASILNHVVFSKALFTPTWPCGGVSPAASRARIRSPFLRQDAEEVALAEKPGLRPADAKVVVDQKHSQVGEYHRHEQRKPQVDQNMTCAAGRAPAAQKAHEGNVQEISRCALLIHTLGLVFAPNKGSVQRGGSSNQPVEGKKERLAGRAALLEFFRPPLFFW
jgi:hypothetical protein